MDIFKALEAHHKGLEHPLPNGQRYRSKPGVRGEPVHPALNLLHKAALQAEVFIDASSTAGLGALLVTAPEKLVLEPSEAALLCARATFAHDPTTRVQPGVIWQTAAACADTILLMPPADKGSKRVQAEFQGAFRALKPGGSLWLLLHKDQGAKRYEKEAAQLGGLLRVIAKDKGWRLSTVQKRANTPGDATEPLPEVAMHSFTAAGLALSAYPGVYAAGKLDPGSKVLLDALSGTNFAAQEVLDLGCGYGILGLVAAQSGAKVTALDDDLLAVGSSRYNAQKLGLALNVLHSDINSALSADARFDLVLCNPPFHVGKQVKLAVPYAFLGAACQHLKPGGSLYVVANEALPYEAALAAHGSLRTLKREAGFKVLLFKRA